MDQENPSNVYWYCRGKSNTNTDTKSREFEWFINFSALTSQSDLRSKMQDQYSSGVVKRSLGRQ